MIHFVRHHRRLVENEAISRWVIMSLLSGFHDAQNKAKCQIDVERNSLGTEDGPQHRPNVTHPPTHLQSSTVH